MGIVNEDGWKDVDFKALIQQQVRLPLDWKLVDLLTLVKEVYNSSTIIKSKNVSFKKSQAMLRNMFKTIFPKEGK